MRAFMPTPRGGFPVSGDTKRMKRIFVAIGIATLAVAMAAPLASATLAQDASPSPDASPQPDGLAAVCEANATDDASLAMCLEIVETVLAPPAQRVRVVTVPTADEFYAGMTAVLPPQASVEAGKLKGVSRYADEARAYLVSVVPDPCYDNMYASAWGSPRRSNSGGTSARP